MCARLPFTLPCHETMSLGTVPSAANCRRSPSCAGCRASWPVIGPFVPSPSPPRGGPAGGTKADLLHGTTRTSLLPLRIVAVAVSRCSDPQRRANTHRGTEQYQRQQPASCRRPRSTPKVTPGPAPDDTLPSPSPSLRPQHLVGLMANATAVGTAPRAGHGPKEWSQARRVSQGSGPSIAPVPVARLPDTDSPQPSWFHALPTGRLVLQLAKLVPGPISHFAGGSTRPRTPECRTD
jgi:hypothetical protein